jgi:FHS family L-fucose permease-like MFS transporter
MNNKYKKAFYLLTSLFFMWGLITVLVDSLIPRIRDIFELSFFEAGLVQFAFFMAYGLISIPAGALLHKIGYKKGIIVGLIVMGLGCLLFIPAASFRLFPLFMLGYFILASGMTVLQVAANPYVTVLGDEKSASSRLNLSQAFNALGTAIAPAIGAVFILSDTIAGSEALKNMNTSDLQIYLTKEASAVQMPFLMLAASLLFLAFLVKKMHLPQLMNTKSSGNYMDALKDKKLLFGIFAIFLYVGAEVSIGSYLVNYFIDMDMANIIRNNSAMVWITTLIQPDDLSKIDDKGIVASFVMFYWGGAMIGRFIGSYLTKIYKPNLILSLFAALAILFIGVSMSTIGLISMWSILAVGLVNSIMFPTIFSIAIEDLGDLKAQGSGLLCTAIAGGAIIPPLYGFFTDLQGFKMAFVLIMLCYAYIFYYGKRTNRSDITIA